MSSLSHALGILLSARQKRRYVAIQTFFIAGGLLQVIGAGSVAPFVALLSKPEILHSNGIASALYTRFGFASDAHALAALAILMIALLAVSNGVAALTVWITYRFSLSLGAELQNDLMECYLRRPYARIASINSSILINNVAVLAPRFAFNVMQPLMTIASNAAIVAGVIAVLLWFQPKVVLIFSSILAVGYGLLFLVVRRRLVVHGERLQYNGHLRFRQLTESLGGLKAIRLACTEERYRKEYMRLSRESYASESVIGVLSDTPRFVLETIVFSALLLLAVVLLLRGEQTSTVIATLSIYAMTGYRLLPSAQAVFKALSQVRANAMVIDEILPDIVEGRRLARDSAAPSAAVAVPSYPASLHLSDVWFSYPDTTEPVLRGVEATIPCNRLSVLVGHSGSGKSTLSDLLLGLLPPDRGQVLVGDVSVHDLGRAWFRSVGYVPQDIFLVDDSIASNTAFGSSLGVDLERVRKALDHASLLDFVEQLPGGEEYRVGERGSLLSGGQRQRLGIARALYHDANYLILDEATSALDNRTEAEVLDTLLKLRQTRTIVMIAHRLSTIRAADHIIMLADGRVVAEGPYDDLITTNDHFRSLVASAEPSGRDAEPSTEIP